MNKKKLTHLMAEIFSQVERYDFAVRTVRLRQDMLDRVISNNMLPMMRDGNLWGAQIIRMDDAYHNFSIESEPHYGFIYRGNAAADGEISECKNGRCGDPECMIQFVHNI